jgi:hypothetical protein
MLEDRLLRIHDLANQDPARAVTEAEQALNEHPNHVGALSVAAYAFLKIERFGVAYSLLERACKASPEKSALWSNLGMCALGCMDHDLAIQHLRQALKLDNRNSSAMNNLALAYVNKGDPIMAIQWGEKARELRGDDPALMETLGYANLMLGRWEAGWEGFEGSLGGKIRRPRSYHGEPYWDGSPVKTLVVRGEQGIGDEISFASVYGDVQAENVVIECDKRLEGLFQRSFPYPVVGTRFREEIPWADGLQIDAHVLSGSLCRYYRKQDKDFPGKAYLVADPERRIQWRALLDSMGKRPKIGIAWTGGRHNTHSTRRSLSLEDLLPILRMDADFVSLQYKDPRREIAEFEATHGIRIHHWARAAEAVDYDETAALVAELDVVVSVQTAVVHLAGALGKECRVLVPAKPHWRYGMSKDRMPWYESVRLYRQKGGDWATPITKIASELQDGHGPLRNAP